MVKYIHTVTTPCGTILKRTSQSRQYSHMVAVKPSLDHARKSVFPAWKTEDNLRKEFKFRQEMFQSALDSQTQPDIERHYKYYMKGCQTSYEYVQLHITEHFEWVQERQDKGFYDTYGAYGWNSRLDLAEKLKRKVMGPYYDDVVILEPRMVIK